MSHIHLPLRGNEQYCKRGRLRPVMEQHHVGGEGSKPFGQNLQRQDVAFFSWTHVTALSEWT